jgi:Domain of unknown function (DUF6798)
MNQTPSIDPGSRDRDSPLDPLFPKKEHSGIFPSTGKWIGGGNLLFALLFLTLMDGALYGSSDDMFIIPGVYQIESSNLYPNDLAFRREPGTFHYHAFGQYVLFLLSRGLPIEYCIFFFISLWRLCLVAGLFRLAQQIGAKKNSALAIAILISFNPHLVGYNLTGNWYAVHFAALALSILSLSYWISGPKIAAFGLWFLAVLFHPLIGAGSLIFFLGVLICRLERRNQAWICAALLVGLGLIGFGGIRFLSRLNPGIPWVEVARIKLFVRGPWHLSPEYWGKWEIINYVLVMLFLISAWKVWREEKIRILSLCGVLGGGIVAAGILNNLFLFEPFFIFLNPFEIGPIVLALAYVLAARFLSEMVEEKYYLSSLAVFLSLSLQTWSVFFLVWALRVFLPEPSPTAHSWRRDLFFLFFAGLAGAVQLKFWGRGWIGDVSSAVLLQRIYAFLFAAGGFFLLGRLRKLTWETWVWVLFVGFLASAAVMGRWKWFEIQRPWEKDWQEVCEFSFRHSSVGSTFIIPPDMDSFQYLSRRSSFFSFKHLPPDLKSVREWYGRLQRLGLVSPGLDPKSLRKPVEIGYDRYNRLETEDFLQIKGQYSFIDYCIVRQGIRLSLPEVFSNASYRIYRLPSFY